MIDSYFRGRYQKGIIEPLLRKPIWDKIHPNFLTFLGAALGCAIFPALHFNQPIFAVLLLVLSGFFDTLDGSLARCKGEASPAGAVLDITADRLVEFCVILGLFAIDPLARGWLCMGMLGSILLCITTFLVVGIFTENESQKGFHYSPGLMERGEAFIFFSFMIMIPSLFSLLAYLFMILVSWTAYYRLKQFTRNAT